MGRVRQHLDRIENPDKARAAKAAKADAGAVTEGGFDLRTREGLLGALNGGMAGLAHWAPMSHRDALENAMRVAIEIANAAK